jgi:hypothetical protein
MRVARQPMRRRCARAGTPVLAPDAPPAMLVYCIGSSVGQSAWLKPRRPERRYLPDAPINSGLAQLRQSDRLLSGFESWSRSQSHRPVSLATESSGLSIRRTRVRISHGAPILEPVCKRPKRPGPHPGFRGFESHPVHHSRDVAQLVRARGSGPRGRWFESSHPDHLDGERSLIGKAPDCETGRCEFESRRSHQDTGSLAQRQSTRLLTGEMKV